MTVLLCWRCWGACQEGVCRDPHFCYKCTSPRFSGELPSNLRRSKTHHFPCNGLENDAEYGEEKADRKNKRPFVTTLAAPPQRATAARWRGPHQGGVRWSAPWAGASLPAQHGPAGRKLRPDSILVARTAKKR